jgi:hypothetical protein
VRERNIAREEERQMSPWDFGGPPARHGGEYDEYSEYGEYREHGESRNSDDFDGGNFSPISYERDLYPPDVGLWLDAGQDADDYEDVEDYAGPVTPDPPRQDTTPLGLPLGMPPRSPWPDQSWPPRVQPPRSTRWLIPVAVAVAAALIAGTTFVLLRGGHQASPPAAARPAAPTVSAPPMAGARSPLTMGQARQILASYTNANNAANDQMSYALLGTIETGSSYAIDAGIYRVQRAEKAAPYPAFGPRQTRFYIPRLPVAQYPHWFVVQVANASLARPSKVTGTEYLVFTQATPGAPWRNAVEPYVVGGAALPQLAVGADGLAIPVNPDATSLVMPPAAIAQVTAAALDGGKEGIANPGNLADRLDAGFWHSKLPAATVTDRHMTSDGQVFGLQTADGGALLFYTDAAMLTLMPPAGEAIHLTVPGFYSSSQSLRVAMIGYLDQFATYVPPRGGTGMRVVADYSGITQRH